MRSIVLTVSTAAALAFVFVLSSVAGAGNIAPDVKDQIKPGVVSAYRLGKTDYCHLRFPPINRQTLDSNVPTLLDASLGVMVDYYGPCDHDPIGELEIMRQRDIQQHERSYGYE